MSQKIKSRWVRVHLRIMLGGSLMVFVGVIIGGATFSAVECVDLLDDCMDWLGSVHKIVGYLTFSLLIIQVVITNPRRNNQCVIISKTL